MGLYWNCEDVARILATCSLILYSATVGELSADEISLRDCLWKRKQCQSENDTSLKANHVGDGSGIKKHCRGRHSDDTGLLICSIFF